jgi:TusA-related sulfurtransferase
MKENYPAIFHLQKEENSMSLTEIDARGLACPEPVVMTKSAVEQHPKGVSVLVDNICAVENIARFAKNSGYAVQKSQDGPDYRLDLTKQ